jgi:preprotein translocase subunit SecA
MGQIREESVGFLFNLEVEVTGGASVEAKGLAAAQAPQQQLSYSAPGVDGDVEVRNQRGQLEQAATAKAQQAQAEAEQAQVNPAFGRPQQPAPAQGGGQQGGGQASGGQAKGGNDRGAFGQRTGNQAAPQNRAQRRAQEKRR